MVHSPTESTGSITDLIQFRKLPEDQMNYTVYKKNVNGNHLLRIIADCDDSKWLVECETRHKRPFNILLSERQVKSLEPEAPEIKHKTKKSAPVVAAAAPILDDVGAPFTMHIHTRRVSINKHTDFGVYSFTGEIKHGQDFHARIQGIIDTMFIDPNDDYADFPYLLELRVQIKSSVDKKLKYVNTAQHTIEIGDSGFELVSREILALSSTFFERMFYGNFIRAEATTKIRPMKGETNEKFEEGMSLLLFYVMYRKLTKLDKRNARLLLQALYRFGFYASTYRLVEHHLIGMCNEVNDDQVETWDAALCLANIYHLNLLPDTVVKLYAAHPAFNSLVEKLRGQLSAVTLECVLKFHRINSENATYDRISHIYLDFYDGRVVVQLNRAKLPRTNARMVDWFAPNNVGPAFYWDLKGRLVSTNFAPDNIHHENENSGKSDYPSGAWVVVLRAQSDIHAHSKLIIAKSRPRGKYLGHVVKGEELLREGQSNIGCGILANF